MLNDSSIASTQPEWEPRPKDIKKYLHFDADISKIKLADLANDKGAVTQHAFMPLIRFTEKWTKFRVGGSKKIKKRPIRYCSRKDAAIFAKYRKDFSVKYEEHLS